MNSEKEIQELKERLAKVEGQLQQKSKSCSLFSGNWSRSVHEQFFSLG